jgi:hypothetical protein
MGWNRARVTLIVLPKLFVCYEEMKASVSGWLQNGTELHLTSEGRVF